MNRTALSLATCLSLAAYASACYSGGNNCFPAGTRIQTPLGDARVETLKVGDEVLAFDAASGKEVTTQVVKTHVHRYDATLERLTLSDGTVLEATPEHPLFSATRKGWAKTGDLAVGEQLKVRDGKGGASEAEIMAKVAEDNRDDVYNLETAAGNYFAEGVLAKYY